MLRSRLKNKAKKAKGTTGLWCNFKPINQNNYLYELGTWEGTKLFWRSCKTFFSNKHIRGLLVH